MALTDTAAGFARPQWRTEQPEHFAAWGEEPTALQHSTATAPSRIAGDIPGGHVWRRDVRVAARRSSGRCITRQHAERLSLPGTRLPAREFPFPLRLCAPS